MAHTLETLTIAFQLVTEGIPKAQVSAEASVIQGLENKLLAFVRKCGDILGYLLCLGEQNKETDRHENAAERTTCLCHELVAGLAAEEVASLEVSRHVRTNN